MRISFNASAVIANNSLTRADNRLSESLARLSSGLKIVGAKDNPSGLAMSKRMNAQIEGISVANQNASDGISIIEIADGTLSEIHEMLQRANELCVKGSNGTLTSEDRKMIDAEIQQLKEEIERICSETQFNGQNILDGSFDLRGYTSNTDVKVSYYSDEVKPGSYSIEELTVAYDENGNIDLETAVNTFKGSFPGNAKVTQTDGNVITITSEDDFEMKVEIKPGAVIRGGNSVDILVEDFGSMDMQIGANEGQQLGIRIPKMSLENMGISVPFAVTFATFAIPLSLYTLIFMVFLSF